MNQIEINVAWRELTDEVFTIREIGEDVTIREIGEDVVMLQQIILTPSQMKELKEKINKLDI